MDKEELTITFTCPCCYYWWYEIDKGQSRENKLCEYCSSKTEMSLSERIDRMMEVLPRMSIANFPEVVKLIWEKVKTR